MCICVYIGRFVEYVLWYIYLSIFLDVYTYYCVYVYNLLYIYIYMFIHNQMYILLRRASQVW